jgi:chromosomal replication initiator protein
VEKLWDSFAPAVENWKKPVDLWEDIKRHLASTVTAEGFENWVCKTSFLRMDGQTLWVAVPDEATRIWMEKEYVGQVASAIRATNAPVMKVMYVAEAETPLAAEMNGFPADSAGFPAAHLNPKHSFDSFVVGSCNQLAHAAAWSVATQPAKKFNPLFIYGGTGLGKTHLLQAIGRQLAASYGGLRIVYTSSERFMNFMVHSLKADRMQSFQRYFRTADVLLVDDVHNLAGKERTQEEFFYTFNELHEHDKQIVLTSDSAPKTIAGLVDRLRSRFEWGLMVDLQAPDLETRMAILAKKAEIDGLDLPEEVRVFIAARSKTSVRELESALIKLGAYSSMTGEPISLSMAEQVLRPLSHGHGTGRRISIESIIRAVGERFGLQPSQLKMKSNERKIAYPRQIAMYLTKELTGASLPEIGRSFGGKHHTTVLHSIQKIEALRLKDAELNAVIQSLTDSITA